MQLKDSQELFSKLKQVDLILPPIVIISGPDNSLFDQVNAFIQNSLLKHESVQVVVLTGEPNDSESLFGEIFNMPLFAPYRFFVIKNAAPIFKYLTASDRDAYQQDFSKIAERTLLLMYSEVEPTKAALKPFGNRLLHLSTKNLFAENIESTIRRFANQLRLSLTEEAMSEIRERIPTREGAIIEALQRLKEMSSSDQPLRVEFVRDILFPKAGWDMFRLSDACFLGDTYTFSREIMNYNPPEDNFLALLRVLLNRTDELRKYRICRKLNLSQDETTTIVGIKNRHPFLQKKILQRLSSESQRYNRDRIEQLYQSIVDTSSAFRLTVPIEKQSVFFQKKAIDMFFHS
ncbi:MAG: hypothetical protein H3C43_01465 [Leptonema sp. (in: Bacteria)]|nr:hypothetical protein [Leptonema sp. (in: bacteria)]